MRKKNPLVRGAEHTAWSNMIQRCTNPNLENYKWYGARGIQVCQRWRDSFQNFYDDLGARPSDRHSLERHDVNGHYEPSNCHWATHEEQANNKRNNVRHIVNGISQTEAQLARQYGIAQSHLRTRLAKGISIKEALEQNIKKHQKRCYAGEEKSLKALAEQYNVPYNKLYYLVVTRSVTLEDAMDELLPK